MIGEKKAEDIMFLEAVQDYGGARISTVELAERLAKEHNITIVDFYGSCIPFVEETTRRGIKLKIVDKRDNPYIVSTSSKLLVRGLDFLKFFPHLIWMRKNITQIIHEINPAYIVVNNFKVLLALIFFQKKNFQILFFARGWFIPAQISKIERIILKKCVDKYLCVSQATRHALYAGGLADLEDLHVVPNAIDESKTSKEKALISKGENTTLILHAAGFLEDKGQLVSLEIAKSLKERGVDFKLILAGIIYKGSESESFLEYIEKIISKFGLKNHVEIVLNKSNVITYFNACDLLIHPSETEGLPRVIMEAMILKKPVVANAVGGVTDYILHGYTGFLPHHNSHLEYVKYIEALINDKDLYNKISSNAYRLVSETYTEKNQINSLFNVFK